MSTIAKSYYITHVDSLIIEASSFRRPFDDLYDELNGLLNSDNLSTNLALAGSGIIFIDTSTFYTATNLQDHLTELLPPGYHDVHFFAYGNATATARRLCVFPGRIETLGTITRVKSRLNMDISSIPFLSASFSLSGTTSFVGVFVNQVAVLTASDFFLYNVTGQTLAGHQKFGLYNSTATSAKRGLYSFMIMANGDIVDNEFLTPPVNSHRYLLTESEALQHTLYKTGYAATSGLGNTGSGGFVTAVHRSFDMSMWRYSYEVVARPGSATSTIVQLASYADVNVQDKQFIEFQTYDAGNYTINTSFLIKNNTATTYNMNILQSTARVYCVNRNVASLTSSVLRMKFSEHLRIGKLTDG